MGRWSPPAKASSPYITPAGAQALRQELDHLWRGERPQVVQALAAAAAEGDRSENAEYIYRKKQLAQLDRRIRYLNKRLGQIQVVQAPPHDLTTVRFGAWVQIADEADQQRWLRIVGADETDAGQAWISVDSPMARALLGRKEDDEFQVTAPAGQQTWWVLAVRYSAPDTLPDANVMG